MGKEKDHPKKTEEAHGAKAETRQPEPEAAAERGPGADAPGAVKDEAPHPFEALMDEYPLREPADDPRWAVRIVRGWLYFLAFNFAWIFLFLILGLFYP